MTLHMYTTKPPTGRWALFAQKLSRVAGTGPIVQIADRLFWNKHPPEQPAVVRVRNPEALKDLLAICAEYGISVKTIEEASDSNDQLPG
jgi:hypothetical protein